MDEKRGLYGKYEIRKRDGSPVDPGAVYFTLRLDTDPHVRKFIDVQTHTERLSDPLCWQKPARVFVIADIFQGGKGASLIGYGTLKSGRKR